MSQDTVSCKNCKTQFVLPKKVKDMLGKAEGSQILKLEKLLPFCPRCRAQTFPHDSRFGTESDCYIPLVPSVSYACILSAEDAPILPLLQLLQLFLQTVHRVRPRIPTTAVLILFSSRLFLCFGTGKILASAICAFRVEKPCSQRNTSNCSKALLITSASINCPRNNQTVVASGTLSPSDEPRNRINGRRSGI